MASKLDERIAFVVEWYDPQAQFMREYQLFHYLADGSVEMFDIKNRRTFLKRTKTSIPAESFYVGANINLFSRLLHIKSCADQATQQRQAQRMERSVLVIKPEAYENTGKIIDNLVTHGFQICALRFLVMGRREAEAFYALFRDHPSFNDLVATMEGKVTAIEVMRENAIQELLNLAGPSNVQEARRVAPNSLRAVYGLNGVKSGVHVTARADDVDREMDFFFGKNGRLLHGKELTNNSTLAIVKPHAVLEGHLGKILDAFFAERFEIQNMQMFQIGLANAEEFLEVYKGVVPEYRALVDELISGPLVAIAIGGDQAVAQVRNFVGPIDPEIGKHLRPKSVRTLYGRDKVQNAVHATDLPEDGVLEAEYFFKILST